MRLTAYQLAEYYGVDERTVTNWVNSKPPCPSRKEGGRRYFDSVQVAAWREAKVKARAAGEELDFEKAKARKMAADAELAEMEVARTRGEQVSVVAFREAL